MRDERMRDEDDGLRTTIGHITISYTGSPDEKSLLTTQYSKMVWPQAPIND